jgi:hypothetical protein
MFALQRIATIFVAVIVLSNATLFAQTRKRKSTRPASSASTTTTMSVARRQGASRVADQIKNLSRFLYLLGGVARGIEVADEAARSNEASPAILEQTRRNKQSVRTSIQAVREGLDKLELDFRTNPDLNRYYIRLAGVAAGAARAEQQAASNEFEAAGRTLIIEVANRLTDVLLEMSQ